MMKIITLEYIAKKLQELCLAVYNIRLAQDLIKKEASAEISSKVDIINSTISDLRKIIEKQDSEIPNLNSMVARQDQYYRRNNLEIAGIPDSISNDKLEKRLLRS